MNPIEFARNLFLLRREHNMTIEDLAAAMEVTPERICEWECAKTSPSLEQMNRLSKVYGIPLADIIRTPKSHEVPADTVPEPENVAPEPEAAAEEPAAEPEEAPEEPKKKRPAAWEIIVIVLLVLIIGAAMVFLIKPEWCPFRDLLGAWSTISARLLR